MKRAPGLTRLTPDMWGPGPHIHRHEDDRLEVIQAYDPRHPKHDEWLEAMATGPDLAPDRFDGMTPAETRAALEQEKSELRKALAMAEQEIEELAADRDALLNAGAWAQPRVQN